jgi:hypothetical protein
MSARARSTHVGWVEKRDPTSGALDVNLQFVTNQPDMISSVSNDSFNVGNDSFNVGNDSLSVGNDSLSVGNDSLSVGNDSLSVGNDSFNVGNDSFRVVTTASVW